jgi:uncharacterized protein
VFLNLMMAYPNFYLDLSALSLPLNAGMIFYLRRHPEYFDRYLFGTDYPLSVLATPFVGRFGLMHQFKLWSMKNIFDKQAAVLEGLRLRFGAGTTERLLNI